MPRSTSPDRSLGPRRAIRDAALDEACLLAELRFAVEGARTAAEERMARAFPDWSDRLDRVCARYGR